MVETAPKRPSFQPQFPLKVRFLNGIGTPLKPLIKLNEESLLSEAQRQTGLSDWGDESFRVPFQILLKSLNREANLHFVGRSALRQRLLRLLVNRLRIQDHIKRYPEVLDVPIKRPLFILGLPRTGTTFLHNLLAQDPTSRWLRLWEILYPCPPPHPTTEKTDPRIQETAKQVQKINTIAPQLSTVHHLDPQAPEEGNQLFEHGMVGFLFEAMATVPSYTKCLQEQELFTTYRYYRQQLQLLGWNYPDKHWILKAPFHLLHLDALLTAFPDACIVHTHRNPLQVLPSMCSLCALVRGIYSDRVDLQEIGQQWLNNLAKAIEKAMKVRQTANSEQFYDLDYQDLVSDPVGTVRRIYDYFDYSLSPEMENNMKAWIANHPQHKYGAHHYTLEQFGLDAEIVNARFSNYRERFNIA